MGVRIPGLGDGILLRGPAFALGLPRRSQLWGETQAEREGERERRERERERDHA